MYMFSTSYRLHIGFTKYEECGGWHVLCQKQPLNIAELLIGIIMHITQQNS
jgi:hypothetical protein